MDFKNTNRKNQSRFAYSKSFKVFVILFFGITGLFAGCSSKKSKSDSPELVYFDSLEGEVHLLSTVGENTEVYFSPTINKLLFVRDNPNEHKTPQIYEKNMIDKTERRLTFNLGENHNPQYHPTKAWVLYSSSADELVEKIDVFPAMKDLGLKVPETKANLDLPQDIYISAEDGSDLKRIYH
jgi:Tol biopolymer transport system component